MYHVSLTREQKLLLEELVRNEFARLRPGEVAYADALGRVLQMLLDAKTIMETL